MKKILDMSFAEMWGSLRRRGKVGVLLTVGALLVAGVVACGAPPTDGTKTKTGQIGYYDVTEHCVGDDYILMVDDEPAGVQFDSERCQ